MANVTPCRVGTRRLFETLEKITAGEGTMDDLDNMEQLCYMIKDSALCGLGQTAPNPILSTMNYFHQEYVDYVTGQKKPSIQSLKINVSVVQRV